MKKEKKKQINEVKEKEQNKKENNVLISMLSTAIYCALTLNFAHIRRSILMSSKLAAERSENEVPFLSARCSRYCVDLAGANDVRVS